MEASDALQFTVSAANVTRSLYLIVTRYDVIAAPLVAGAVHFIVTVSGLKVVVGWDGVDGTVAAKIEVDVELAPYP